MKKTFSSTSGDISTILKDFEVVEVVELRLVSVEVCVSDIMRCYMTKPLETSTGVANSSEMVYNDVSDGVVTNLWSCKIWLNSINTQRVSVGLLVWANEQV